MCVLAPICGSQRLYRPRKIRALAQDSRMTVALRPVSGLRTPLRWLCLNCCESGNVTTAQLEFLGYTIPNQAFSERPVSILVMPTLSVFPTVQVSPSSNLPSVPGILGLGPNAGSVVYHSLNNQTQGDTVVDRIFQQNVSSPNILTVLLGRSNDPAEKYPGDITVGEIIPGMENITSEPKIPVTINPKANSEYQHWQVLLDANGIIGPDGKPIQVQTTVQGTPNPNQLTTVFDTGYTFPQVPQCVCFPSSD